MSEWWHSDDLSQICDDYWHKGQLPYAIEVHWHDRNFGEQRAILQWLKDNLNCLYNIRRYWDMGTDVKDGWHRFSFSNQETAALFKLFCA